MNRLLVFYFLSAVAATGFLAHDLLVARPTVGDWLLSAVWLALAVGAFCDEYVRRDAL